MNSKKPALLIFVLTLLLGCTPAVTFTQYSAPQETETINVELVALDNYRNSDTIELAIVSRSSCADKPVIAQVATIGSKGFFGKDSTHQAVIKLPASQSLNLSISNVSSSGYVTTQCYETRAAVFDKNKQYKLKVHNWSSPNSAHSSFGCKFDVVEVGSDGADKNIVKLDAPQLPTCGEK